MKPTTSKMLGILLAYARRNRKRSDAWEKFYTYLFDAYTVWTEEIEKP